MRSRSTSRQGLDDYRARDTQRFADAADLQPLLVESVRGGTDAGETRRSLPGARCLQRDRDGRSLERREDGVQSAPLAEMPTGSHSAGWRGPFNGCPDLAAWPDLHEYDAEGRCVDPG